MTEPDLKALENASRDVYEHLSPSPQLQWLLFSARCGCSVWVEHGNHNPPAAFKVRGRMLYLRRLLERDPAVSGVVAATRGNHGQSITYAAARFGIPCTKVVPEGDNPENNLAMAAHSSDTHNVAEGADTAPLAALLQEGPVDPADEVGLILSGGKAERQLYRRALASDLRMAAGA